MCAETQRETIFKVIFKGDNYDFNPNGVNYQDEFQRR